VEELVTVGLRLQHQRALDARREPHVGEGRDGDVDGRGVVGSAVAAVDYRADHGSVHGGGEDGALDAAGGEERGHVGCRDEMARRQEGEEEDVHRLLLIIDGHGCVESRVALSHETLERPEEQRRVFVAPVPSDWALLFCILMESSRKNAAVVTDLSSFSSCDVIQSKYLGCPPSFASPAKNRTNLSSLLVREIITRQIPRLNKLAEDKNLTDF
jgi:hypothetical protein